jgi:hypothetical protein
LRVKIVEGKRKWYVIRKDLCPQIEDGVEREKPSIFGSYGWRKIMFDKRIFLRIFLFGEIVFFVTMYVTSPEGLASIENKKIENKQLALHIKTLTEEIKKLEDETKEWENNPFYREKVAREQLQMARPTDEVYYVS